MQIYSGTQSDSRRITLGCTMLFCLAGFSGLAQAQTSYKQYTTKVFTFSYPADWKVTQLDEENVALAAPTPGIAATVECTHRFNLDDEREKHPWIDKAFAEWQTATTAKLRRSNLQYMPMGRDKGFRGEALGFSFGPDLQQLTAVDIFEEGGGLCIVGFDMPKTATSRDVIEHVILSVKAVDRTPTGLSRLIGKWRGTQLDLYGRRFHMDYEFEFRSNGEYVETWKSNSEVVFQRIGSFIFEDLAASPAGYDPPPKHRLTLRPGRPRIDTIKVDRFGTYGHAGSHYAVFVSPSVLSLTALASRESWSLHK
jgi:hypothetical protein